MADSEQMESLLDDDQKQSLSYLALLKWATVAATTVASLAAIYFFCVFLPLKYLPETHKLEAIQQLKVASVELRPVDRSEVMTWGIIPGAVEDKDSQDEEGVELSEIAHKESLYTKLLRSRLSVQAAFQIASNTSYKDRHILIGDIHGQRKELKALLRKLKYNKKRDHLLVLGDFIAKGRDSLGVVDDLIDADAKCILGNHEYYVLQFYAKYHGLDEPQFVSDKTPRERSVFEDGYENDPEFKLAKKLEPHHVEYINNCPVMYKIGKVPLHSKKTTGSYKTGTGVAVHAGLRWDLTEDLNDQSPLECLQMRSYIGPHYNETTDDPSDSHAVSWSKIWNMKHKDKEAKDKYVVYYGHDARRGVKLKKWSKGLDNGCVKGDHLAAMVIWKEKTAKGPLYREQVVKVKCEEP